MVWLDDNDIVHEECIDCGKDAIEGNRCMSCWAAAGCPMRWSNKDVPRKTKGVDSP